MGSKLIKFGKNSTSMDKRVSFENYISYEESYINDITAYQELKKKVEALRLSIGEEAIRLSIMKSRCEISIEYELDKNGRMPIVTAFIGAAFGVIYSLLIGLTSTDNNFVQNLIMAIIGGVVMFFIFWFFGSIYLRPTENIIRERENKLLFLNLVESILDDISDSSDVD